MAAWSPPLLLSEVLLLAAIAVTLATRRLLRRTHLRHQLDSALLLLAIGLAAGAVARVASGAGPFLYLDAFCVAAVAIGAARAALVLFVDFYLRRRRGAAVSRIFSDVGSVLIYFLIIGVVLRSTLDLDLTSLVATSAVLTAIVGLALQDVLGSVVSGLVIEVEDPFGPGDWIRVGAYEGKVVETGWRTTRLRTRVNELVTLPNTYLAREPVVNYSRPDVSFGETIRFEAGFEVPPDAVKRAALEILTADAAVLAEPPIEIRTEAFNANGVQYAMRFWIDDFDERERIHARVMSNLWYALRRHGIRIPVHRHEVFVQSELPRPELERGSERVSLGGVSLFAGLDADRLEQLAASVHRRIYGDGEAIVRQGEAGDSFFILEQGRARVSIHDRPGAPADDLATLAPGDYFGEMSLLAGDTRSATVTAVGAVAALEIGHDAFRRIVAADPSLLEPMSRVAARRAEAQRDARASRPATTPATAEADEQRLLRRIRAFLRV